MIRKIFFTLSATAAFMTASAQSEQAATPAAPVETVSEPTSSTTISGSADGYFKYDFGKNKANGLTSFTQSHNSFELGMATVKIEHKMSKVSLVADLGFGKRAMDFSYNDQGIMSAVKQLYVSYAPAEWVKFTMGSWATHVGYELVDAYANRNYSMSYMFTNGPFFHTGLKADFTAGKHGFMVGVANPTDYKTAPDQGLNKKFALAQYSFAASDNVKFYLNYVGGQAPDSTKTNQFDLVITGKISDKLSLGYNGTIAGNKLREDGKYSDAQNWGGSALYVNVDPKSWFGLTLRGEYFSDQKQMKVFSSADAGGSVFATTLSANFKINNFTIIPEFRMDNASETLFVDKNGISKKSAGNFLLAAVYSF